MSTAPHFIQADARSLPLADGSIQCAVTSPPYFALRDYGIAGQIGLESSLDAYLAAMVGVFREVHRVLRPDGVAFLNVGDSYSTSGGKGTQGETGQRADRRFTAEGLPPKRNHGIKPKELMGVPWRLALALQADGWYLRADIIWAKPNPMPESVTDRPTKAHEYIFLLTKSERYYWDAEAIKEQAKDWGTRDRSNFRSGTTDPKLAHKGFTNGNAAATGRNARSVWTMSTRACPEAHFATYPITLPLRCIRAGTSERGCCPSCRAPWRRVVDKVRVATRPGTETKIKVPSGWDTGAGSHGSFHREGRGKPEYRTVAEIGNRDPQRHTTTTTTTAWVPGCKCPAHEPVPCTVFDPFNGAGTTGLAAYQLGRRYVGTELNPEYIAISGRRFVAFAEKLANKRETRPRKPRPVPPEPSLFPVLA